MVCQHCNCWHYHSRPREEVRTHTDRAMENRNGVVQKGEPEQGLSSFRPRIKNMFYNRRK